jgi:uncharacterized membrane protein YciS (DUF1049 family)
MKTAIYLRLSLLIPILVWGGCLLFFLIASTPPINEFVSNQSTTPMTSMFVFFGFYTFGIVFWFFPYLLLSLILLASSFSTKAGITMKIFALSPIAMTMLTITLLNLVALGTSGDSTILSNPLVQDQDFISFNMLSLVFSLIWGYICVGIGFGLYKLLRHLRIIRDEENTESQLRPISQHG